MLNLKQQDITDLLYGCAVLGTGGGGSLQKGIEIMEEDFAAGRTLQVASLDELPKGRYIACPYGCGAPSASGTPDPHQSHLPLYPGSPAILAFRGLEEFMQQEFCAVSSTELGGENTAEALHIACMLGLPVADGDPAGRSVPELIHSSFYLRGKSIQPMAVATRFSDVIIIKDVADDFRAESLARAMACVSGNEVSVCDHPMTCEEYKKSVIPGAITYALEIGRLLRICTESGAGGTEAAKAIAGKYGGAFLFKGRVTALPWECRDGFDYGTIYLDGLDSCCGESYRIEFKNENIAAYRNDRLEATVPDLICMLDKNGTPVTNPDFGPGEEMNIFVLPAPEIWTTKEGLEIFGPGYFGIDADYVPFQKRIMSE